LFITLGSSGHGAIVSPATVGMSLLIFSGVSTVAVLLIFQQLKWLATVKPVLILQQQLACLC
jgi:hypothetical protein